MAIVQMPFIKHARNKLANVVFYEQDGINIMRSAAFQPKNPKTEKQMLHRNRMTIISKLASQILPIIKEAYGSSLKKKKPYRRVVSVNLKTAFEEDSWEIDPTKLVICENEGNRPDSFEITVLEGKKIHITYKAYPQNLEEAALEMFFIYFDPAKNFIRKIFTSCMYNDQVADLVIPAEKGSMIHLYACTQDNVELLDGKPRLIFTYCGAVMI
jgi:hypothetical protein